MSKFIFISLLCVTAFFIGSTPVEARNLDLSFMPAITRPAFVYAVQKQPDGKILVGGEFQFTNQAPRKNISRLNPDGSVDLSFNPGLGADRIVNCIAVQPDGKILVGGEFDSFNGISTSRLVRLNPNGSVDKTFIAGGTVNSIAVRPDGKFLIAISSTQMLKRFNADGTPDATFPPLQGSSGSGAYLVVLQPDQKFYLSGSLPQDRSFKRYNEEGTVDDTFVIGNGPVGGGVASCLIQPDGKIVLIGNFTSFNSVPVHGIVRLNQNGSMDGTFVSNGLNIAGSSHRGVLQDDGKIIVGGFFTHVNANPSGHIMRLNSDGTLDATYSVGDGFDGHVRAIVLDGSNVIVGGDFDAYNTNRRFGLTRLTPAATVDGSFNAHVGFPADVHAVKALPNGKTLIGGSFDIVDGIPRSKLALINENGSVDTSFNADTIFNDWIETIDVQPDGKVLVGGNFFRVNGVLRYVARLNTDGTVDSDFNAGISSNSVVKVKVLGDGKIMVSGSVQPVGSSFETRIARLNSDGSPDASFSGLTGADGYVGDFAIQADGKIVVVGGFATFNGVTKNGIARLNADGSLDPGFTTTAFPSRSTYAVAIQPDGKILIGGNFETLNGVSRRSLARLNADSSTDPSFIAPFTAGSDGVYKLLLRPNGKIVVSGGTLRPVLGQIAKSVVQLNENGTENNSVNPNIRSTVLALESSPSGKVLVGGNMTFSGDTDELFRFSLARLIPQAVTSDFDFDGKSDVSVFRPSEGNWYSLNSTTGFSGQHFGATGDKPTPGDFDGDGKIDISVFRPSEGNWYRLNSSDGSFFGTHFGLDEDKPAVGDFDGDGKADISVFRPSEGNWYRLNSSDGSFFGTHFGATEDKPAVGDFDGDGRADISLFRPSEGNWYRLNSSNGQFVGLHFGISADKPTPADYDGDGKTDIAVYRPANGDWFRVNSSDDSFFAMHFGTGADKPVPGDYDGDGKADIGVFRPSEGNWYTMNSTTGFSAQHFGAAEDLPTPNVFVY